MATKKDGVVAAPPQGFPGDEGYQPDLIAGFLALAEDSATVADPAQVQRDILARILGADDFDAALDMAEGGTLGMEDLTDTAFTIDAISWHKSSPAYTEGLGVFALLAVTLMSGKDQGEQVPVTCGGVNVLGTLKLGLEKGAIPDIDQEKRRQFRFIAKGTARGFTTYWLARA